MDLASALRAFVRIVQTGSLTAAARDLGISQPAVSKLLRNLEAHVDARLVDRTPRALRLTSRGEVLYDAAREGLSRIDVAIETVRGEKAGVAGILHLRSPVCLGEAHLQRIASAFSKRHPGIAIDLTLDNGPVDLVRANIDLAFHMGQPSGQELVARRIGAVQRLLVASPDYLGRRGQIRGRADLGGRELLVTGRVLSRRGTIRLVRQGVATDLPVRPVLTTNAARVLLDAVTAGQGIAVVQTLLVADALSDGRLVRVLPDEEVEPTELFLSYASARHVKAAVRSFIDFAVPALRQVVGII